MYPSLPQQETSIMLNMCEMCSFVLQEKSGSLPGQSYTSSKNASRSDHSPVFGEYSLFIDDMKVCELMMLGKARTCVYMCVCTCLMLYLLCARAGRQAGRQAG
jgi:hypothetical protein